MTTRPLIARKDARKTNLRRRSEDVAEIEQLRAELAEAKETLTAIQSGDVDAVVVSGPKGDQLFTLKGAEYAYRLLVEAMNEGATTLSHNGIVLYCNKQLPLFVKLTPEKVIGQQIRSLIPQEHIDTFNTLFAGALGGTPGKSEIDFRIADGGLIPVLVSLSRVENDDTPAVCMVVTDLTEQKQRDAAIAAGNLARAILDQAVEPIAVCDSTGRIIIANDALQNLCDVPPLFELIADVLPLQVTDASGVRGSFSWHHALRDDFDLHKVQEVVLDRAGFTSWLLLTANPMKDHADNVIGFLVTLLDVTERKLAERAVLRSEKLAALGRMAATIAHEINNPLESVMNALFIAQGVQGLPEPSRKYLEIADTELRRVAHIARQSLGFYRDSNAPELTSVNAVLESAVALLRNKIDAKSALIEKQWDKIVEVTAVPGELRQVFCNLLANSLDAINEKGTIKLRVSTCSAPKNGHRCVRVTLADNGRGISPTSRLQIFEPFFTTKGSTGTGLGLWVSKQIVDKHGGTIQVRSRNHGLCGGTVFSIVLPLKPPALTPGPA